MGFFCFGVLKWSLQLIQGLDALGIATLDSITSTATASIPFISFFSFSSMTDEDKVNLRTLHRLMLLVSGHQSTENTDKVRTFASSTLQCSYIIIKRERERERESRLDLSQICINFIEPNHASFCCYCWKLFNTDMHMHTYIDAAANTWLDKACYVQGPLITQGNKETTKICLSCFLQPMLKTLYQI